MEILVKTVKGKTINLEVDDSSETIDIKIRGEPISQVVMRLAPVQGAAIKIFVSTLKGKTFNLEVKGSETIQKSRTWSMIRVVRASRICSYKARLADSRTIAHYNINTGANLIVMSELCGC